MYKKNLLRDIGSMIGQVIKVNKNTDNGDWECFACKAIGIDLRVPLI